jgi:hypothetical protein
MSKARSRKSASAPKSDRRLYRQSTTTLYSVLPTSALVKVFGALIDLPLPFSDATPIPPGVAVGDVDTVGAFDGLRTTYAGVASEARVFWCLAVAVAVVSTMPAKLKQWEDAIFVLARRLHAIPSLNGVDASALAGIVPVWYAHAESRLGKVELPEVRVAFASKWANVTTPLHPDTPDAIAGMVMADLLPLPPEAAGIECKRKGYCKRMGRLLTLCWAMQHVEGEGPFFLSGRKAGELLGTGPDFPSTALRYFVDHLGVLVEHEKGRQGRATRYRFRGLADVARVEAMLSGFRPSPVDRVSATLAHFG